MCVYGNTHCSTSSHGWSRKVCLPRGRDGALRPQTLEVAGPGVEESDSVPETESDSSTRKLYRPKTRRYTRVSGRDESRRVWTLLELAHLCMSSEPVHATIVSEYYALREGPCDTACTARRSTRCQHAAIGGAEGSMSWGHVLEQPRTEPPRRITPVRRRREHVRTWLGVRG